MSTSHYGFSKLSFSGIHMHIPKHKLDSRMLSRFQASYQRVEHSLQRLTDSIAAYNPSATAADELVAADDAINENLEQRWWSLATPIFLFH